MTTTMCNTPPVFTDLQKIRRLRGSSTPWLCAGPDGKRYCIKVLRSDQAAEEVLADHLYAAAGIPVPRSWMIDLPSSASPVHGRLTEWIDGEDLAFHVREGKGRLSRQAIYSLFDGLALDIILQNEDVLGRHGDNIIIDINGPAAWRIDNGSALRWTAVQGPRYDFGPVPDLHWLRQPWPSLMFDAGGERVSQGYLLRHIRDSLYRLDDYWPAVLACAPEDLHAVLNARRDWLYRYSHR